MSKLTLFASLFLFYILSSSVFAENTAKITQPENGATVANPVKVCLAAEGIVVEPASNGINEGKGHHHLLVNTDLPADLTQAIPKDDKHIHMGDGASCKELTLTSGKHTIRSLFAKGNHIPYNPPITSTVEVTVK